MHARTHMVTVADRRRVPASAGVGAAHPSAASTGVNTTTQRKHAWVPTATSQHYLVQSFFLLAGPPDARAAQGSVRQVIISIIMSL